MIILVIFGRDFELKRSGFMVLENFLSIIFVLIIVTSVCLSIKFFDSMYRKYEHNNFKTEFLNFINLGKYKAFVNSGVYTLKFYENAIALLDKSNVATDIFRFPKSVRMTEFNGIYNRHLNIQRNGLIARGATFTYKFYGDTNEITISAVTGKVNYD